MITSFGLSLAWSLTALSCPLSGCRARKVEEVIIRLALVNMVMDRPYDQKIGMTGQGTHRLRLNADLRGLR